MEARDLAEEQRRIAERKRKSPQEKAVNTVTDLKMELMDLRRQTKVQEDQLQTYKDRRDAAIKDKNPQLEEIAQKGIRETRPILRGLREQLADKERALTLAEAELKKLKEAEEVAGKINAEIQSQLDAEDKEIKRLVDDSGGVIRKASQVGETLTTDDRNALKKAVKDYEGAVANAKTARNMVLVKGSDEKARTHNKQVSQARIQATRELRDAWESLQDVLLRTPADGGPINPNKSAQQIAKEKGLSRSVGFRGTPAASASAPAPAPATPPKTLKRREIVSSDRDVVAEKQMEEFTKKLADVEAERKAAEDELADLKAKAKTIRIKSLTFSSGDVKDVEGVRKKKIADLEDLLKKLETTKSEVETAQKNFVETKDRFKRIQTAQMPAQAKSEETKLEKTKEEIEAEREKIARDLASAQARLRLAQRDYRAKAQRRGGKKNRKQTRKNRQ